MILNGTRKEYNYRRISKLDLTDCTDYYIFLKCIKWILQDKYDLAYRLCCRYNSEKPFSPGINCDWNRKYREGLSRSLEESCMNVMKLGDDPYIAAAAIYSFFSGVSVWNVSKFLIKLCSEYNINEIQEEIMYSFSLMSCNTIFNSYQDACIDSYRFLATLDERTCPVCGKLDGQVFYLRDKKIGVNCPPMHKGCRCTTVSGDPIRCTDTRYARDSNGRGIKVPASMNWTQWKEEY